MTTTSIATVAKWYSGFLAIALIFSLSACSDQAGSEAQNPEPVALEVSDLEIVGTRYDVTVESGGYEPTTLQMKVGEEATLVFTRMTESTCGETVIIPSIDVERELPLRQPVAIPFTPTKTGEIAFACGMSMMKGAIIVVE